MPNTTPKLVCDFKVSKESTSAYNYIDLNGSLHIEFSALRCKAALSGRVAGSTMLVRIRIFTFLMVQICHNTPHDIPQQVKLECLLELVCTAMSARVTLKNVSIRSAPRTNLTIDSPWIMMDRAKHHRVQQNLTVTEQQYHSDTAGCLPDKTRLLTADCRLPVPFIDPDPLTCRAC